jgi:hypothetical protein
MAIGSQRPSKGACNRDVSCHHFAVNRCNRSVFRNGEVTLNLDAPLNATVHHQIPRATHRSGDAHAAVEYRGSPSSTTGFRRTKELRLISSIRERHISRGCSRYAVKAKAPNALGYRAQIPCHKSTKAPLFRLFGGAASLRVLVVPLYPNPYFEQ